MKITYLLAASYARGGIKVCIEHCNRLYERGHDIKILGKDKRPDWIEVKAPWEFVREPLGTRLPPSELVVFSFCEQAFFAAPTVLETGIVPIYFIQGDELVFGDPTTRDNPADIAMIEAAQASVLLPYPLLTVSAHAARKIMKLGGRDPAVLPNGIDRTIFRPSAEPVANEILRVLSVGSEYSRFKGVVEICGALMKLWREGVRFSFVRVSPTPDAIGELEFPVEFHHNPSQEELAKLYAEADIFVGASHSESFFLTPLEAMSCGTAVVCSDLEPVREYAEPGRDFLAFPPGDVPAMTRQLRRVLRYKKLRDQLVERGLRAAERMDWNGIIPRLEQYFADQLKRKNEILADLKAELDNPTIAWSMVPPDDHDGSQK